MRRRGLIYALVLASLTGCVSSLGPEAGPRRSSSSVGPSTAPPGGSVPASANPTASKPAYEDFGPVGGMARAYLRATPARRLVVEVAWVAGFEPNGGTLAHLEATLRDVADKPEGVSVVRGTSFSSSAETYSVADIRNLEARYRGRFSGGDTATMWIVYLNGRLAEQEGALGVAYGATSAAVFRERLNDATTAIINEAAIERAVASHEMGHLLGLVNIGYRSRRNHEDAAHPNHSSNQESVMYWAIEDVSVRNVLGGGPPDRFDADDRADLEQLKSS